MPAQIRDTGHAFGPVEPLAPAGRIENQSASAWLSENDAGGGLRQRNVTVNAPLDPDANALALRVHVAPRYPKRFTATQTGEQEKRLERPIRE